MKVFDASNVQIVRHKVNRKVYISGEIWRKFQKPWRWIAVSLGSPYIFVIVSTRFWNIFNRSLSMSHQKLVTIKLVKIDCKVQQSFMFGEWFKQYQIRFFLPDVILMNCWTTGEMIWDIFSFYKGNLMWTKHVNHFKACKIHCSWTERGLMHLIQIWEENGGGGPLTDCFPDVQVILNWTKNYYYSLNRNQLVGIQRIDKVSRSPFNQPFKQFSKILPRRKTIFSHLFQGKTG
jgi:hypothetical protein